MNVADVVAYLATLPMPPDDGSTPPPSVALEPTDALWLADWSRIADPGFASPDQPFNQRREFWAIDSTDLPADLRPGAVVGRRTIDSAGAGNLWDVCAWYQSITFHGLGFGIYIRQDCLFDLALDLAPWVYPPGHVLTEWDARALIQAAFFKLFLHEQFHHKVESLAIRLSLVERRATYRWYWQGGYGPHRGTDDAIEEGVATADAYHRLAQAPYSRILGPAIAEAIRRALAVRIPNMPPGYRIAGGYLLPPLFEQAEAELAAIVHEGARPPSIGWLRWELAAHMYRALFPITSRIWMVVSVGGRSAVPATAAPLSDSSRNLKRYLTRLGFQRDPAKKGKGSHEVWVRDGFPPINVPGQADLTPGVAHSIAKQLGLANGHQLLLEMRTR